MAREWKDFYEVLGLEKRASSDEIKARYRQLARELHPDPGRHSDTGDVGGDEERFKAVTEAYAELGNEGKREIYDETYDLQKDIVRLQAEQEGRDRAAVTDREPKGAGEPEGDEGSINSVFTDATNDVANRVGEGVKRRIKNIEDRRKAARESEVRPSNPERIKVGEERRESGERRMPPPDWGGGSRR